MAPRWLTLTRKGEQKWRCAAAKAVGTQGRAGPGCLPWVAVPPGNLLTPGNEDSEDAVASFVDGLLNSGGASGSNQPHPFDQPPPFE
ncbi:hypothetical protein Zm00014a_021570 [Zea mays]|uniref:Uncharacterized protein n=1 Tax=Zea mays TaxID=4577 RepID=A0A3L6FT02_MAIZE|nr:hypothetical protein Zm00014a_021570 [Zea mays]